MENSNGTLCCSCQEALQEIRQEVRQEEEHEEERQEEPKVERVVKVNHNKKFKSFQIPRYLPGQVDTQTLTRDLKEYNKHRYHVFTAVPKIDTKPPQMSPNVYVNAQRLSLDGNRVREINRENKEILKKINTINRNGGKVDSFNPHAYANKSNWRAQELKMRALVKDNVKFYQKITGIKSNYCVEEFDEFWKHVLKKLNYSTKFPLVVMDKKPLDLIVRAQPSISNGEFVERPKCFMDFRVKEGVYLGRIIIELYHDYVPVTVQNFISICCNQNGLTYKNCTVHRVSPGLFIETGDITKGNGKGGISIYGTTFPEENHVLKHSRMGVLSMVPVRPKLNNSQFSISLMPIEQFDNTRVVFGKVIKGNATLCKMNDLGRKYGRPVVPILINNCGKFIPGKTPSVVKYFKY